MKINLKKSISVLLLLCLMISMAIPALAASGDAGREVGAKKLNAIFEEARFSDVGLEFYTRELGFENGVAVAADETGSFGLVDDLGKTVVPYQYESIEMMEEGLYLVRGEYSKQLSGVINARGEVLVPLDQNLQIGMMNGVLHYNHYNAEQDDSVYVYPDGTPATRTAFDTSVKRSYNGYKYYIDESGGKGVLSPQGNVFMQAGEYDEVKIWTNGPVTMFHTVKVLPDGTYLQQYWTTDHQEIISSEGYDILHFNRIWTESFNGEAEGDWYFLARKGDQTTIFDHYGQLMIPWGNYEYDSTGYAGAEGYFYAVEHTGGSGDFHTAYIYHNGALVRTLPRTQLYNNCWDFVPGTVTYCKDDDPSSHGLMDFEGNVVIPASPSLARYGFKRGVKGQVLAENYGANGMDHMTVYGADFKPVPELSHHLITTAGDRWYTVRDTIGGQEMYGLYDSTGNSVFPQKYTYIDSIGSHLFFLEKDGKYSLVNDQNQTIIAPTPNGIIVPERAMAGVPSEQDYYDAGRFTNYLRYHQNNYVETMTNRGLPCKTVLPVVSNSGTRTNPVFRTYYVDLETGETEGYLDCLASAIDDQGRFTYLAENGKMGFATLIQGEIPEPHLFVTGGRMNDQKQAVVRIVLDSQQFFDSGEFLLNYDSSACKVTEATSLVPGGEVISEPGQVRFKWTGGAGASDALLEVHFDAERQSPLTLSNASLTGINGPASTVNLHNGRILPRFVQMQPPSAENTDIRKNDNGSLTVKADIVLAAGEMNMAGKVVEATVVIASYADQKMSLTGFTMQKQQIHFDENGLAQFPAELTCGINTGRVKVFLLSANHQLVPFSATADILIQPQP